MASADPDIDASTLVDPALIDCISQSMLQITLDPPSQAGLLAVTYPFEFVPGSADGGL